MFSSCLLHHFPLRTLRKIIALLTMMVQEIFFTMFLGRDTGPTQIFSGKSGVSDVWMLSETPSTGTSISHMT